MNSMFPHVSVLRLGLNALGDPLQDFSTTIKELDLHGNKVEHPHSVMRSYPALERLTLSSNLISFIPPINGQSPSPLEHLNLANNDIKAMEDFSNLSSYGKLKSIQYTLTLKEDVDQLSRLLLIKYLPQLQIVNKTKVTQQEREDSFRLGHTFQRTSHTLADDMITLIFVRDEMRIAKKVLKRQSVRQLKGLFARLFKLRPTSISSLRYHRDEIDFELTDDLAQVSYYALADEGVISATT